MRPSAIKHRDVAPVQTFAKAAAKCSAEVSGCQPHGDGPFRLVIVSNFEQQVDYPSHPTGCTGISYLDLQARIYGACVTANYENIERNMCQKEFLAFKTCVQQKVS